MRSLSIDLAQLGPVWGKPGGQPAYLNAKGGGDRSMLETRRINAERRDVGGCSA